MRVRPYHLEWLEDSGNLEGFMGPLVNAFGRQRASEPDRCGDALGPRCIRPSSSILYSLV